MADEPYSMFVVERGLPGVRVLPLDQQVSLLGAAPEVDLFVDNHFVSRMHAQVIQDGDHYRIRDLGSKNGTFVNGTRLKDDSQILQSGDKVELAEGQVVLRFQARGTTLTLPSAPSSSNSEIIVDSKTREVWVRADKLEPPLSRKEFDVLELLYNRRGEACSKDEIAAVGWPERDGGAVGDSEIEQSVRRLRLRIESDPSKPYFITTVRGFGYRLTTGG